MKNKKSPKFILIVALFCLNCQTENPQDSPTNYEGLMYGFSISGGLDDPTTGAAINLQDGMNNDTLYVFDQVQGDQKIRLSAEDVILFAETIKSTIIERVGHVPPTGVRVDDGTKVTLYERNHDFRVNVQIQIVRDIKTELPRLDSLINRIQAKGAKLNY